MVQPGQITRKLSLSREVLYKVVRRHRNGSITIQTAPYETKDVSMCRLHTYYRLNNNETTSDDNE